MVWRCFIPSGRSFIIHWWLFQNTFGLNNLASKPLNHHLQRVTTECLIGVLPMGKKFSFFQFSATPCTTSQGWFKVKNKFWIIEYIRRISSTLEQCHVSDLLVQNYGDNDNGYDEGIVIRVAESYVSFCFEQTHCKNIFHWKIDRCFSYPSCKGWEPWCKKFLVTCRSIAKRCSVLWWQPQ